MAKTVIEVEIRVDTKDLDETIEKVKHLAELVEKIQSAREVYEYITAKK